MKLEKELNKPKYNLTSHEVEQILKLFSTAINDIIDGELEYDLSKEIEHSIEDKWIAIDHRRWVDWLNKQLRQRKKRWLEGK